jgi:hypothetical protein
MLHTMEEMKQANIKIQKTGAKESFYAEIPARF